MTWAAGGPAVLNLGRLRHGHSQQSCHFVYTLRFFRTQIDFSTRVFTPSTIDGSGAS